MSIVEPSTSQPVEKEAFFHLDNLHCASCVSRIEGLVQQLPHVKKVSVSLASETLWMVYDSSEEDLFPPLFSMLKKEGYSAFPISSSGQSFKASWSHVLFLILSICLALPFIGQMALMLLGFSPLLSPWQSFFLATLSQVLGAICFYRIAFKALKMGRMTMEVLISLGISVAYLYSVVALLLGAWEHLYFETSALLVAVLLLGRFLEIRSRRQAGRYIQQLLHRAPKKAWVLRHGKWVEILAQEVVKGDQFRVGAGEVYPVDGEILEGSSSADESTIFGESLPRSKRPGDLVYAGTLNYSGIVEGVALRSGEETVFSKIVQSVEAIQHAKPPIQRLVDKVCAVFVPLVLVVSLITWLSWWMGGHAFEEGVVNAISVLLIACPCALGLATPIVMVQASKEAYRAGIFVID